MYWANILNPLYLWEFFLLFLFIWLFYFVFDILGDKLCHSACKVSCVAINYTQDFGFFAPMSNYFLRFSLNF